MSVDATAERGTVGGIEVLPICLLVLVGFTLLVANAWAVVDARGVTDDAAREAARAFAETPADRDPWAEANLAATRAVGAAGRTTGRASISIESAGPLRCAPVTVEVTYRVPTVLVPGRTRGPLLGVVRSRHTTIVDPYRSGLGGDGCR